MISKVFNYFGYDGYGTGMEKAKEDLKQAEKWLLEAAGNGEKRAYSMLGHIYDKYKNYPEAIKWYRMDADAGNQYSYGDLAEAYKKTGNYIPMEMVEKPRDLYGFSALKMIV